LRAPVVEGEQAVPDGPLARDRAGDAGAQVQAWRSFSFPIQAAAISCPAGSACRMRVILANWTADRCSRFRTSRFLMPYSGRRTGRGARTCRGPPGGARRRSSSPPGARRATSPPRSARRAACGVPRTRRWSTCRWPRPGPRSATRQMPRPASMRCHQRCGPRPAPAAPAPRTGQRSTCAACPRPPPYRFPRPAARLSLSASSRTSSTTAI
jgi:hypothetical protein